MGRIEELMAARACIDSRYRDDIAKVVARYESGEGTLEDLCFRSMRVLCRRSATECLAQCESIDLSKIAFRVFHADVQRALEARGSMRCDG